MIFIFTFHGVLNHGATLQAYALQEYLKSNGFEAQVVNYQPLYFAWQVYRPAKSLNRSILKLIRLFKFRSFRKTEFSETKRVTSTKQIQSLLKKGDICITGSDQIWNKNLTNKIHDLNFFLNFEYEGVRKAAYAASAGGSTISSSDAEVIACLNKYDFIGVREESLRKNLTDLCIESTVEMVVDPTLLISNYEKLFINGIKDKFRLPERYIATYEVSTDNTRTEFEKKVKEIQDKYRLPVVHIGDKELGCAEINRLAISPSEWLTMLNESCMVCTNSYHGMLMAINLEKPFFLFPHLEEEKNVRLNNVIEACDLSNELCKSLNSMTPLKEFNRTALNEWVSRSKTFLNSILKF